MDKMWHYAKSGSTEKNGPVSGAEVQSLLDSGVLSAKDLAWAEGMETWKPLGEIPDFARSVQPPPAIIGIVPDGACAMPAGLQGWMTFVGVMNIVTGILTCLGCVTVIIGIPMIIAGVALLAAKNAIEGIERVDASLETFFVKLKSFVLLTGVVYILNLVFYSIMLIVYFGIIMAAIGGASGSSM